MNKTNNSYSRNLPDVDVLPNARDLNVLRMINTQGKPEPVYSLRLAQKAIGVTKSTFFHNLRRQQKLGDEAQLSVIEIFGDGNPNFIFRSVLLDYIAYRLNEILNSDKTTPDVASKARSQQEKVEFLRQETETLFGI